MEEFGLERVDIIKADVEGWECRVLAGALCTLRRFRPRLVLEYSPDMWRLAGDTLESLHRILGDLSYDVFGINEADGSLIPADHIDDPQNITAIPRE